METIGRTIREGRWKEEVRKRDIDRELKALRRKYGDIIPQEVFLLLSKNKVSSLELHYIKRKYYDEWKLKSPEELDKMMVEYLKKTGSIVYPQGERYVLYYPPERMVTVIEIPNYRISLYRLKDIYEDYEDYLEQVGGIIFKSWQLEQLLRKLT